MSRFFVSIVLLISMLTSSCTNRSDYTEAPLNCYDYYSGGNKQGNHYTKVQSFKHSASGKKVTLIGMIHTGDHSYYKKVDEILDNHDIVLQEGIHGLPSFGIHKYFSKYIFYTIKRFNYLQGLSSQGHTLKDRDNTVLADMSSDEFASEGSFYTPIIQLASIPIMIIFTEPYYLYEKSKSSILGLFSEKAEAESRAKLRHTTLSNMELADKPSEAFLPGIINSRNEILIKELEKQIKKAEVKSIAIPWGASHLPLLHHDLLESGYELSSEHKWLRSIAVEDYVKNYNDFTQSSDYFGIPYLIETESTPKQTKTGILFSSVSKVSADDYSRFSLLYGDLLDIISTDDVNFFLLFPRISGKPILFDYLSKGDKYRFRFLWFFKFGELN